MSATVSADPAAVSRAPVAQPSPQRATRARLSPLLLIGAGLLLWWLVGATDIAGHGSVPTPWATVHSIWLDRSFYPAQLQATLTEAVQGLAVGAIGGILGGIGFELSASLAAIFRGPVIVLVCVPVLIWAPLLAVAFSPHTAKVGVAAVSAFLPILIGTVAGLKSADADSIHMVRAFGGGPIAAFVKVRVRSALPLSIAGLQVAVPAAILGATIGEYVGGDSGLGIFMLQSLRQYLPARTWGAGLVVTLLGAAGYVMVGLLGRRWMPPAGSLTSAGTALAAHSQRRPLRALLLAVVLPVVASLGLWWLLLKAFGLDSFFAKTPRQVLTFFATADPSADTGRSFVWHALMQTIPGAALGIALGLGFGLGMAMLCVASRSLESALIPVALMLQSVPLQAFSPILVLVFGRGIGVILIISVVVSFFPTLVLTCTGLRQPSEQSLQLFHGANASGWQTMLKLRLPAALPSLIASAKIAVPASVLGVLVAEFIATGDGIGHALALGQATSDFDLVWGSAAAMTVVTVAAYALVGGLEWAQKRFY